MPRGGLDVAGRFTMPAWRGCSSVTHKGLDSVRSFESLAVAQFTQSLLAVASGGHPLQP